MNKFKVWFGYRHSDYNTVEMEYPGTVYEFSQALLRQGGMKLLEENGFVPWHRISFIEFLPSPVL